MRNKRLARYVLILAGILVMTFLLPFVIRAGSSLVISKILQIQTEEDETESEMADTANNRNSPFRLTGIDQSQEAPPIETETGAGPGETENTKTKLDKELQAYRDAFHPKVEGTKSGLYEIFIGDREAAFVMAVADYMFSVYGDSITIDEIDIADFVSNDETQVTCQILLRSQDELAYYYASYSKKHDFYSIYAYHE